MPERYYDEETDRADFEREAKAEAEIDDLRVQVARLRELCWSNSVCPDCGAKADCYNDNAYCTDCGHTWKEDPK